MTIRTRISAWLAKEEASEGVDPTPTAADDAILHDAVNAAPQGNVLDNPEVTGALDVGEPQIGTVPMQVTGTVPLKGSGSAGTAPDFGVLLKGCGLAETITTAIPAAGTTTAAAGTETSFDIDTSVVGNEDWPTTEGALVGMPVTLSNNPAPAATTFITGYTLAGDIATVTVADSFTPALDGTTEVKVEPNVLYSPASAGIPTLGHYVYRDGLLWKVLAARGSFSLNLPSGDMPTLDFTFPGLFGGKEDQAVPSVTVDPTGKLVWKGGVLSIERAAAAVQAFTLDLNVDSVQPDDPNAAEGLGPTVIIGRDIQGTINPLATLVATRDILADFRSGSPRILNARIGSAADNRVGITIPRAKYRGADPGDRGGLATDEAPFQALGADDGTFIAFW